jgi:hypothetical protein
MKTGRLSKAEWDFIERNADDMTAEDIAKELDRDISPVLKHLQKIGKGPDTRSNIQTQAEYDIKSRPYWEELKNQFSEKELSLFVYHWREIIAQFRKDILPTEEMQIIDMIKLEILMNRALREQQDSMRKIAGFEGLILAERQQAPDQQDRETIFGLERQIATLRAAKEALSREYKDLQTKKAGMFKDLKGTREQRIQKLENNQDTFDSLVQKLLRDPEHSEQCNMYLEKFRLAIIEEKKRLSAYHTYGDGKVDAPFLNHETIMDKDV